MPKLIELLKQLNKNKFYGSIEIKFENGEISIIKKIETIKP